MPSSEDYFATTKLYPKPFTGTVLTSPYYKGKGGLARAGVKYFSIWEHEFVNQTVFHSLVGQVHEIPPTPKKREKNAGTQINSCPRTLCSYQKKFITIKKHRPASRIMLRRDT